MSMRTVPRTFCIGATTAPIGWKAEITGELRRAESMTSKTLKNATA